MSFKIIDRCRVIPITGFREIHYGRDNRVLGYWLLGMGDYIFNDSVVEYNEMEMK